MLICVHGVGGFKAGKDTFPSLPLYFLKCETLHGDETLPVCVDNVITAGAYSRIVVSGAILRSSHDLSQSLQHK